MIAQDGRSHAPATSAYHIRTRTDFRRPSRDPTVPATCLSRVCHHVLPLFLPLLGAAAAESAGAGHLVNNLAGATLTVEGGAFISLDAATNKASSREERPLREEAEVVAVALGELDERCAQRLGRLLDELLQRSEAASHG